MRPPLPALAFLLAVALSGCSMHLRFMPGRFGEEPWTRSVLEAYEETLREADPGIPVEETYIFIDGAGEGAG